MLLDVSKVPSNLSQYLSLAARWGITDEGERDALVRVATPEQLQELVNALGTKDAEVLFQWLSGPESFRVPVTPEYAALTCLTMAFDYAELLMRQRSDSRSERSDAV